jgi:hypothetical protein
MANLERSEWNVPLLRTLFDTLLEGEKYRRRSDAHELISRFTGGSHPPRFWISIG